MTTEEFFKGSVDLARKCDQERKEAIQKGTQDSLPFLHGIPISIKDFFDQKGIITRAGTAMRKQKAKYNAACVAPLLEAGAIPMVRGNVPQAGATIHAENPVFGRAMNPYDHTRSCGGSSGGDAGLVAARCVPIAIGSDIGGSIRIPATFTGTVGFKPTQGRISAKGYHTGSTSNFDYCVGHLKPGLGPLARSVRDCIEFFKV